MKSRRVGDRLSENKGAMSVLQRQGIGELLYQPSDVCHTPLIVLLAPHLAAATVPCLLPALGRQQQSLVCMKANTVEHKILSNLKGVLLPVRMANRLGKGGCAAAGADGADGVDGDGW